VPGYPVPEYAFGGNAAGGYPGVSVGCGGFFGLTGAEEQAPMIDAKQANHKHVLVFGAHQCVCSPSMFV
jgi:hypothetical protein